MTPRSILVTAKDKVSRDHVSGSGKPWQLATDRNGKSIKPTHPHAAYWSSVGAVIASDPVETKHWPDATYAGKEAIEYLEDAAETMGFSSPTSVDINIPSRVREMFDRAINAAEAEEKPRRRSSSRGTGANPKGVAA
jgi:hypothetical protein